MCIAPLAGWRARKVNPETGKRSVVFHLSEGFGDMPVTMPCGQCWQCRLRKSRDWALRCMHEASLHDESCFITLTYAEEFLPEGHSLVKLDFQLFMKRLRKFVSPVKVRFYACGEYGDLSNRPHYHAILFGYDFKDKEPLPMRNGFPVYRSEALRKLWPVGLHEIGSVTFQSAAYVARYVMKKQTGKNADYSSVDADTGETWSIEPEFAVMSRRPGIGRGWYEKYKDETYRDDGVLVNGKMTVPPRYYDGLHELVDPVRLAAVRVERKARALGLPEEMTAYRREQKEEVAYTRSKLFKRGGI